MPLIKKDAENLSWLRAHREKGRELAVRSVAAGDLPMACDIWLAMAPLDDYIRKLEKKSYAPDQ